MGVGAVDRAILKRSVTNNHLGPDGAFRRIIVFGNVFELLDFVAEAIVARSGA